MLPVVGDHRSVGRGSGSLCVRCTPPYSSPQPDCASLQHLPTSATTRLNYSKGSGREGGPASPPEDGPFTKRCVQRWIPLPAAAPLQNRLPDPGEEVQHRHRFLRGRNHKKIVLKCHVEHLGEWSILKKELGRYLSGSHFTEDVPEPKRFISRPGHDGFSIGWHGLHRVPYYTSSTQNKDRGYTVIILATFQKSWLSIHYFTAKQLHRPTRSWKENQILTGSIKETA